MSLIGAFSNGVSALSAYSEALGAVSQNIANIRTPGYRQADTQFATLLGGVDARGAEPGGVRSMTRRYVDIQGPIEATSGQFDLAIDGIGFFVFGASATGSSTDVRFSRAGNLIPVLSSDSTSISYLGNDSGLFLLGWDISAGQTPSGGIGTLRPIPATNDSPFPGQATANATLDAILPATGSTATTQVFYVDAAGARQSVTLDWTKTSANTWDLQAADPSGAPIGGVSTMTFNGTGALSSSPTISIGGLFTLDVENVVQRGSVFFLADFQQDGIESGEFVSYKISEDGTVNGFYSSGAVRPLYQIPVAVFASANQLGEESASLYYQTETSGEPTLIVPDGAATKITPSALELANFDLSDGFTRMIVVQRAYDTAAQVVRTVDEMSQVVRDMKR